MELRGIEPRTWLVSKRFSFGHEPEYKVAFSIVQDQISTSDIKLNQ